MKKFKSLQYKAAFLMIVFSLNTIIGFACAVGVDMGFNSSHHHDDEPMDTAMHIHADGKKHFHYEEADKDHHKSNDDKDNCCHDNVIKIAQVVYDQLRIYAEHSRQLRHARRK